jgi:hypothetical protein
MDTQKNHYDSDQNPTGHSSEENKGWFGDDEVTTHYDNDGKSTGFSREENNGWFGNDPVKTHYNENGEKVGYSREEERGWLGNDQVTTHYDNHGEELGYTRTEEKNTFFGSEKIVDVHYDNDHDPNGSTFTDDKGGCFLTTACTQYMGLSDNCSELTILRKYRDTYLKNRKNGLSDIKEYYKQAPTIVNRINNSKDSLQIWNSTYLKIQIIIDLIETQKFEEAYNKYKSLFLQLKNF